MNVLTYEFIKLRNDERLRRSMTNYEARRRSSGRPTVAAEPHQLAEVVELKFETGCAHDSIGA